MFLLMNCNKTVMRKIILIFISAAMLFLASCGGGVSDAEARGILSELIPKAEYFNDVFWGAGLPAEEGAVFDETKTAVRQYYNVSDDCPYQTIAELRAAAAEVYSREYMAIISETAFEGTDEFFPRYDEVDGVLRVDIANKGYNLRTKLYPERANVIRSGLNLLEVSIPCDFDGQPSEDYTVLLVREGGKWLLDSPTY